MAHSLFSAIDDLANLRYNPLLVLQLLVLEVLERSQPRGKRDWLCQMVLTRYLD